MKVVQGSVVLMVAMVVVPQWWSMVLLPSSVMGGVEEWKRNRGGREK